MLAINDERFQRICRDYLERPDGDYAELLRRGQVSSRDGVDPEAWRAEIRRKARQDKISLSTSRSGQGAFAILNVTIPREHELAVTAREFQRYEMLRELRNRTAALGHELIGWLRHDIESISLCRHCGARLYVRTGAQRVQDGEALAGPCPVRAPSELSRIP
jgi:hypothetical protein